MVDRSSAAHERHDFGDAGRLLYDFCWGEFADWYIEAAKARLYGQDPAAALQTRQVNHTLCLPIYNISATPIAMVLVLPQSLGSLAQPWSCIHICNKHHKSLLDFVCSCAWALAVALASAQATAYIADLVIAAMPASQHCRGQHCRDIVTSPASNSLAAWCLGGPLL